MDPSQHPRRVSRSPEFRRWEAGLDPERRARVAALISLVAERGSTLGRPHVDVIHGSRLHKLKEIRVDRSARILFAFDSQRNPVMLVGGDKIGKWNRWYPPKIQHAERLHLDHERSLGKEPRWLNRDTGRNHPRRSL